MDEQRLFATGTRPRTPPEHTAKLDALEAAAKVADAEAKRMRDRADWPQHQKPFRGTIEEVYASEALTAEDIAKAIRALASPTPEHTARLDAMERRAKEGEPTRHYYRPSTMHMGDCAICGNLQDVPWHIGHETPTSPLPEDKGRADIAAEVPEPPPGVWNAHSWQVGWKAGGEAAETALAALRAQNLDDGRAIASLTETLDASQKERDRLTAEAAASCGEVERWRELQEKTHAEVIEHVCIRAELDAELAAARAQVDALAGALRLVQADVRGQTQSCGVVPNTTMHVIHRVLSAHTEPSKRLLLGEIPTLVRDSNGWFVRGEDGTRYEISAALAAHRPGSAKGGE